MTCLRANIFSLRWYDKFYIFIYFIKHWWLIDLAGPLFNRIVSRAILFPLCEVNYGNMTVIKRNVSNEFFVIENGILILKKICGREIVFFAHNSFDRWHLSPSTWTMAHLGLIARNFLQSHFFFFFIFFIQNSILHGNIWHCWKQRTKCKTRSNNNENICMSPNMKTR